MLVSYEKHIFTDRSKDPKSVNTGSAVVIFSQAYEICKQTVNNLSVHTVEFYAILIALEQVEQSKLDKVLIRSDSVSALSRLTRNNHELFYEIMSWCCGKQKGKQKRGNNHEQIKYMTQ